MQIIFYLALTLALFSMLALLMAPVFLEPSPQARRIMGAVSLGKEERVETVPRVPIEETILSLSRSLRTRLGITENAKLQRRLVAAGMRGSNANDQFFAVQLLLPLSAAFLATFIPENTSFWVLCMAVGGYLAPDLWLSRVTKRRNKRIRKSMPDAIDLLVICVEAGLGLDQALLRISSELYVSHPDIHEEFAQVNLEQRAGVGRLEAWQNLAARTDIDEFASFVGMLTQTDRFGTPILKALSRFAQDIRQKRRQRAEEAAAKTKIKIIFPLVLCIFPSLFIVLLGPALLTIMSTKGLIN